MRIFSAGATVMTLCVLCGCDSVHEFPPDVAEGGRIIALTRDAGDPNRILAGSPTGGLFRSVDGGIKWQSVSGLPSAFINDVAYAPGDPSIVLVTFDADWREPDADPIYRSADGGHTWSPASSSTTDPVPCQSRRSANGISFQPNSSLIYVATSCGLAVSEDLGTSWTIEHPYIPGRAVGTAYYSVLAQEDGRVVAIGSDGVWLRDSRAAPWRPSSTPLSAFRSDAVHALAASPIDARVLFAVGVAGNTTKDSLVVRSLDGGEHWDGFAGTIAYNREPFVRASARRAGHGKDQILSSLYDLYVGDGSNLWRYTVSDNTPAGSNVAPEFLPLAHSDPTDISFDSDGVTLALISGDGGVMKPTEGTPAQLVGGGRAGLNALQLLQVTGQVIRGDTWFDTIRRFFGNPDPHHLYYATQDNYIKSSDNGGTAWRDDHRCCESPLIQLDPVISDLEAARVQLISIGNPKGQTPCYRCLGHPLLQGIVPWPDVPDLENSDRRRMVGIPVRLPDGSYLQGVNPSNHPTWHIFRHTPDFGSSWDDGAAYILTDPPIGQPVIAQTPSVQPTEFVIYQTYVRSGVPSDLSQAQIGLLSVRVPISGAEVRVDDGLQSVALRLGNEDVARMIERPLIAVDPSSPKHLLAVDAGTHVVKYSMSGGREWYVDQALTAAVSQGGRYVFWTKENGFIISEMAWDPTNTCHILVGAHQGGIYETLDQGESWHHIEGSEQISSVTSFYFPPSGDVIVSSYGRGLWRLSTDRTPRACARRVPRLPPVRYVHPDTGAPLSAVAAAIAPEICQECVVIVAHNGALAGVEAANGRLLRVALKRGNVYEFDSGAQEIPLEVPSISPSALDPALAPRAFGTALTDGAEIKGLIIRGGRINALIVSEHELSFRPRYEPVIYLAGEPATEEARETGSERSLKVNGSGFIPGRPVLIRVRHNLREIEQRITPDELGGFRIEIPRPEVPRRGSVLASQQNGNQTLTAAATFEVPVDEED